MLFIYYLLKPQVWIFPWIIQVIVYFRLLPKMDLDRRYAFLPFLAEERLSKRLYKYKTYYLHVFVLTGIMLGGGLYLRCTRSGANGKIIGLIFTLIAMLIYWLFQRGLYWNIAKTFNKGFLYKIFTMMFPMISLFILGGRNNYFYGYPEHKYIIQNKPLRYIVLAAGELLFIGSAIGIFYGVSFLSTALFPPRFMVEMDLIEKRDKISGLVGDGRVISREDMLGNDKQKLDDLYTGRDLYFPDHSSDRSVVVLEYIIGSNLEDNRGLASYNIEQMKDATKQGDALKFIVQAGGSYRWFTSGIKDETVGRYAIADGKLEMVQELNSNMCMSDPNELYEFLNWAKNAYPADRYILVLWDHGGGLSAGYGQDELNKREDNTLGTMMVNEFVDAIKKADMKFDMIGFDACLMQDIEIAKALEPYADYYLASEESESGDGWYYTSAFGMLAKDPTVSTADFGKEIISSFDLYNAIRKKGEADTGATLSLIDLSRIDMAYSALEDFYDIQDTAIKERSADYTDISSAARNSYAFNGEQQIDLIDYLEKLDESDFDDTIADSSQINELINKIKSVIVYRNAVSNTGINGIAVTFPEEISYYSDEYTQYLALDLQRTENFYTDFYSIMAYVHRDEYKKPMEFLGLEFDRKDYTEEEWYREGVANYGEIPSVIDIPLIKTEEGYKLDLSDNFWDIVIDSQLFMYQKTDNGWAYLGHDVPGMLDENDRPMVSTDGTWIHINNTLVAYEAESPIETEWGVIHKGTVKARLNDEHDILLQIEWEPIQEDSPREVKGEVKGYTFMDNNFAFMEKGIQELNPGDKLAFLFDIYDDNGQFLETRTGNKTIRVNTMISLSVSDRPLGDCDIRYGIVLTDAFQRKFATEKIETHLPQ